MDPKLQHRVPMTSKQPIFPGSVQQEMAKNW